MLKVEMETTNPLEKAAIPPGEEMDAMFIAAGATSSKQMSLEVLALQTMLDGKVRGKLQ